jgi:hypothetical protein
MKILKMRDPYFEKKSYDFLGPFKVSSGWLPHMFASPGFSITKTETITSGPDNPDNLVKVSFQYRPAESDKKRSVYPARGWVVLHPSQYWRVCEGEVENVVSQNNMGIGKTHDKLACVLRDGIPFQLKREADGEDRVGEGDPLVSIHGETTFSVSNEDPPAEAFTLTAFGLPEPITATPPQSPRYWLWFSIAGFAVLAGAAWTYRRRLRAAQAICS